ncbi:MAG: acyl carrier protein, partial [Thiohalophilus sp.]|uniref:acyl carrier protein n=1 Tax=Thiohalophilus sp. TaxID=3028392 RepID=UPI0028700D39
MKNPGEDKHDGLSETKLLNLITELMIQIHPHHRAPEYLTLDSQFETDPGRDSLSRVELISRVESTFHLTCPNAPWQKSSPL